MIEERIIKVKKNAESKLKDIDEFKKTLENCRWNYELEKMEEDKKRDIHEYYIEELKKEKMYKK